jgi:hypothetical protein
VANPFTPTFGTSPPLLVGRDEDLEDFREGLLEGPGSPERATLISGLRGTGKTAMLNAYEDIALDQGWLVVSETARPGLVRRLTEEHLPSLLREHDIEQTRSRLTAVSLPGGVRGERHVHELHEAVPSLRSQLNRLVDVLAQSGKGGVLLTVDEITNEKAALTDLRDLGDVVQHAFRERRDVAFAGAGLPGEVKGVLAARGTTFLRRADRRSLGRIDRADVARALRVPIEQAGRHITSEALDIAVEGTSGYPFMIQLVGLHTWRAAGDADGIEAAHAERGVSRAKAKVGDLVHASAIADLSARDREFLRAMAVDDGPSRMRDIADRMGRDENYASQYRLRLIDAEVISEAGHGLVTYTLPGLRDFLRSAPPRDTWE